MSDAAACFAPVTGAAGEVLTLAMQRLWLTGEVLPVGARLVVAHTFQVSAAKPVEVIYSFPLPRDAALRRFRIEGDHFTAHSELKETEAAARQYEEGIAQGALSALARQYRDGVVNLSLGNLRPDELVTVYLEILAGVESRDDGFRFRFPFTLAPAYHPRARSVELAPGEGEMELPRDEFGDVILPRIRRDAKGLHEVGFELTVPQNLSEAGSPSHAIRVGPGRVRLAGAHDVPDRDLVLDLNTGTPRTAVFTGSGHFAAVIPSTEFGANPDAPRRAVIVLDRSGSMQGDPIQQARKAIEACLGALSEQDQFGLVAFDNEVEQFRSALLPGTRQNREAARSFLSGIDARGGTELAQGFLAAAKMLNGPGDVLILTDGQVAGTETILSNARATGIRLHCLGIGSASQDRFLSLLARETGGVSRFVTPRERVDMAAVDLFASVGRPIATGLKAPGNIQPPPPAAVFAGTPVVLYGEGAEPVHVSWDGGQLTVPITGEDHGETVRLLQGARRITDLESRYEPTSANAAERRQAERIKTQLKALSEAYGLASREMSLVAVVARKGDIAGQLPETRIVAVGMPQDVQFPQYFGAPAGAVTASFAMPAAPAMAVPAGPAPSRSKRISWGRSRAQSAMAAPPPLPAAQQSPEDILMDLATRLEPDGGLPGRDLPERVRATLAALLAYLAAGHTPASGAFRSHVQRLLSFLEKADLRKLTPEQGQAVQTVIELARRSGSLPGDWITDADWDRIIKASATVGPRSPA